MLLIWGCLTAFAKIQCQWNHNEKYFLLHEDWLSLSISWCLDDPWITLFSMSLCATVPDQLNIKGFSIYFWKKNKSLIDLFFSKINRSFFPKNKSNLGWISIYVTVFNRVKLDLFYRLNVGWISTDMVR